MTICNGCKSNRSIPRHVDVTKPIANPPALGKRQACELCGKHFILTGDKE